MNKTYNANKSDDYPLSSMIRKKQASFWGLLKKKGLINEKKYNRLVSSEELTPQKLAGFIERQIVETRQSTKAAASLLKFQCPQTDIVYVKGRHVSEFRHLQSQDMTNKEGTVVKEGKYEYLKVRMLNDLHHAKDAYLSIVAGNVYHTKFTSNPLNYLKKYGVNRSYNLAKIYDNKVERNGYIAWEPYNNGTIKTVDKMFNRNTCQIVRLPRKGKGELFDLQPVKKGKGKVELKSGLDIDKYGGYNKPVISHLMLMEHDNKKSGKERSFVPIPIYVKYQFDSEEDKEFFLKEKGYINPTVLLDNIPIQDSLIKLNGQLRYIKGTQNQGKLLVLRAVEQPYFGRIEHKITKVFEKIEPIINSNNDEDIKYRNRLFERELDDGKLEDLYKLLLDKAHNSIFSKRIGIQMKTIDNSKYIFEELSIEEKVGFLIQFIRLFNPNTKTVNLTTVGGKANGGALTQNMKITDLEEVKLINRSITGLFQTEKDLLKL